MTKNPQDPAKRPQRRRAPKVRKRGSVAMRHAERGVKGASGPLLLTAILTSVSAILAWYLVPSRRPSGMSIDLFQLIEILAWTEAALAAVFWALYASARRSPKRGHIPALVGCILYSLASLARVVLNPVALLSIGTLLTVAILLALVSATRAGFRYEKLQAQQN